jgi:hypothetical protein
VRAGERSLRLKAILVAVFACALILGAGCGGSSEGEGEGPEARASVPESLDATESDAEDIVDLALAKSLTDLREKAADLKADANEAADALGEEDAPEAELAQLRARGSHVEELLVKGGGEPLEIALAANSISALMPDFFRLFKTDVPPDVLELDYLDREAQLRSLAHDGDKVSAAVGQLEQTWNGLRPQIVDAGGEQEASQFTKHVAAMKKLDQSGDASALQREAVNGLELVDALEKVFA